VYVVLGLKARFVFAKYFVVQFATGGVPEERAGVLSRLLSRKIGMIGHYAEFVRKSCVWLVSLSCKQRVVGSCPAANSLLPNRLAVLAPNKKY
jgi:hypothetical protein